ncbi:Retrotransposon gag protein [Quillaja saponaria]|uniref:Retrotransposon gag protein n=1 Tax=Quillaja saponaria TaxID=32244 RepID=A0AAD7PJ78_QUISA|nr:Retrotransposon gag protein [Quillaja saponaria]
MEEAYNLMTLLPRINLPRFDGDNFFDWLYRVEQFFEVDRTPDLAKVCLASINLERRAWQWHKAYMASVPRGRVMCRHYVADMALRFGRSIDEDPISKLAKLKLIGLVVSTARQLKCKLQPMAKMKVMVANGEAINAQAMCLKWQVQGEGFTDDFIAMSLGRCDAILGMQWFAAEKKILWDFDRRLLEF